MGLPAPSVAVHEDKAPGEPCSWKPTVLVAPGATELFQPVGVITKLPSLATALPSQNDEIEPENGESVTVKPLSVSVPVFFTVTVPLPSAVALTETETPP